jgi:hypothetical protein
MRRRRPSGSVGSESLLGARQADSRQARRAPPYGGWLALVVRNRAERRRQPNHGFLLIAARSASFAGYTPREDARALSCRHERGTCRCSRTRCELPARYSASTAASDTGRRRSPASPGPARRTASTRAQRGSLSSGPGFPPDVSFSVLPEVRVLCGTTLLTTDGLRSALRPLAVVDQIHVGGSAVRVRDLVAGERRS